MNKFHIFFVALFLAVSSVANKNEIKGTPPYSYSLESLDDFSLLSILDYIPLYKLVTMASLSPRIAKLVLDHYIIGKYHIERRKLLLSISHSVSIKYHSDDPHKDTTIANDYDTTLFAIQHFGHTFSSLHFTVYEYGQRSIGKISQAINEHCPQAHQELDLYRGVGLENIPISLANVTKVKLIHKCHPNENDTFRLDLAFPRMNSLEITQLMDLNHHYPHMKRFILHASEYYDPNLAHYIGFMRLNPQLRDIHLPYFNNTQFLTITNGLLPNLESFGLDVLHREYETIDATAITRFMHVKTFTIEVHVREQFWNAELRQMLTSIHFEHLKAFNVVTHNRDVNDFLVEWIGSNTEMEAISFVGREMTFQQLTALVRPLTKLKTLTIAWIFVVTLDDLNRFLGHDMVMNGSLKEVNVKIAKNGQLSYEAVIDMVPRGWTYGEDDLMNNPKVIRLNRAD